MSNSEKQKWGSFTQSLDKLLADITTIEIQTILVDEIVCNRFVSWEAYRDIYLISRSYLTEIGIHKSLFDRYLNLRLDLEREYVLMAREIGSEFYDPKVANSPLLKNSQQLVGETYSLLPSPMDPPDSQAMLKVENLLKFPRFVMALRRISEVKNYLDRHNQRLLESSDSWDNLAADFRYAQTTISLDGHITNSYSRNLLNHPDRETLLRFHQSGVEMGTQTWRELLLFFVRTKKSALQHLW
jgi:hypothetical protein